MSQSFDSQQFTGEWESGMPDEIVPPLAAPGTGPQPICDGSVGYMACELPEGHAGPHQCFVADQSAAPGTGETPEPRCANCGHLTADHDTNWGGNGKCTIRGCLNHIPKFAAPEIPQERQPPAIDRERIVRQCLDISLLLADAGIEACPLPEGVRRLWQRADAAETASLRLREGLRAVETRMRDQALLTLPMRSDLLAFADELKQLSESGAE